MLFSRKEVNKLISFVDKNFTYDWRYIQSEGRKAEEREDVLFKALDYDRDTYVSIRESVYGTYVCIIKDTEVLYAEILHTFGEMKQFKIMIKCLG